MKINEVLANSLSVFVDQLKQQYNLKNLWMNELGNRDAIELSSIIVDKNNQNTGIGSAVMADIVIYEDTNGKILVLDPALKDDRHGTTSQNRLRRFYKRFGFIDNKGRKKNFLFRHIMIRYPK